MKYEICFMKYVDGNGQYLIQNYGDLKSVGFKFRASIHRLLAAGHWLLARSNKREASSQLIGAKNFLN